MEEKRINFETAKLAKEKGFDGFCRFYFSDGVERDCLDENASPCDYNSNYWNPHDEKDDEWISAPTQSLLQKWLREVHKINVESNYLPNAEKYATHFVPMDLKKPKEYATLDKAYTSRKKYLHSGRFDTYEEALEVGLFEALKLI